jgi:predicted DNA-binding transcriptional regulator YafY
VRTFRLDRVTDLEVKNDTFDRPAEFDARTYFKRSMPFVEAGFSINVWLDLPIERVMQPASVGALCCYTIAPCN